tara:strand:- start:29 stop:778 length:750 start_codon:yes stop_codon:yes gene_type:complete
MGHKKVEIYKMKDKNESYHKKKGLLFDLPMKVGICGRSQLSGKSNLLGNLLLSEDSRLYKNDFLGDNIYIFSPSAHTDYKIKTIIEEKDIPPQNVFTEMTDGVLEALYEMIETEFKERAAKKEPQEHRLIIADDMSADGSLKKHKNGTLAKIVQNGRHVLISTIATCQKYSDLPTFLKENLTGGCFFSGTDRQLEAISDDHNYLEDKTAFRKMFRKVTNDPHTFLVVNYSNPLSARYMDTNFVPIMHDC